MYYFQEMKKIKYSLGKLRRVFTDLFITEEGYLEGQQPSNECWSAFNRRTLTDQPTPPQQNKAKPEQKQDHKVRWKLHNASSLTFPVTGWPDQVPSLLYNSGEWPAAIADQKRKENETYVADYWGHVEGDGSLGHPCTNVWLPHNQK